MSHIQMNQYQRGSFKLALKLSQEALMMSNFMRQSKFKTRDEMLKKFSETWALYEDLFSIMRILLNSAKGELKSFFRGCNEGYLNDYKLLKSDMNFSLLKTKDKPKTKPKTISEPKPKNEIFMNLLMKIVNFEKGYLEQLDSGKPDRVCKVFEDLNMHYIQCFSFLKGIFDKGEKETDFSFNLSSDISITWQVMTIINLNDSTEWNIAEEEQEKLAMEIGNIYFKLSNLDDSQGHLLLTFASCIKRLANYSQSKGAANLQTKSLYIVDDILENKDERENQVFEFFNKVVKGTSSVGYKRLEQNKYLLTIKKLVNSTLNALYIIKKYTHALSENSYELCFFYQFLKKFIARLVLVEFYKRLIIFEKIKRKLILT